MPLLVLARAEKISESQDPEWKGTRTWQGEDRGLRGRVTSASGPPGSRPLASPAHPTSAAVPAHVDTRAPRSRGGPRSPASRGRRGDPQREPTARPTRPSRLSGPRLGAAARARGSQRSRRHPLSCASSHAPPGPSAAATAAPVSFLRRLG